MSLSNYSSVCLVSHSVCKSNSVTVYFQVLLSRKIIFAAHPHCTSSLHAETLWLHPLTSMYSPGASSNPRRVPVVYNRYTIPPFHFTTPPFNISPRECLRRLTAVCLQQIWHSKLASTSSLLTRGISGVCGFTDTRPAMPVWRERDGSVLN